MRSQGRFGANYSVNGHRTSGERRVDFNKGYSFLFERLKKIPWRKLRKSTGLMSL